MGHSSLVPEVANVLPVLYMSFCFLDHLDLPEFGLNFPPSCLGVSVVFGQPKAISLTWTSIFSACPGQLGQVWCFYGCM